MDHAEARELLESAAAEPGGIERLMAGDTPDAAALAGHLAGCDVCTAELDRVRRDAVAIRDTVRSMAPPDLRERTLAYVAAMGRPRGLAAEGVSTSGATATEPARATPAAAATPAARPPSRLGWMAAIAAAVLLAVVGTGVALNSQADRQLRERDAAVASLQRETTALARVAAWSVRVSAASDARTVRLSSPAGSAANGTILYSPSSGELVVVAESLQPPAGGREMRCWVETDAGRRPVGQMFFGGGLAYWAGPVEALPAMDSGARFGVSVVGPDGTDLGEPPVLEGELEG